MKNQHLASSALTLALSACATPEALAPPKRAVWHQITTGRTYRRPEPAAAAVLSTPETAPGRLRFISTSYRTTSARTVRPGAATALALSVAAGTANVAEVVKADSLLTVMSALNRAADTLQKKQVRAAGQVNRKRVKTQQLRQSFAFQPTNIKPNDTIFIDTMGVRLAFWLGAGGPQFKVSGGVLSKQRNGENLDVSVKTGYDWQPYRMALLVLGSVTAVCIIIGLSVSIFIPVKPVS